MSRPRSNSSACASPNWHSDEEFVATAHPNNILTSNDGHASGQAMKYLAPTRNNPTQQQSTVVDEVGGPRSSWVSAGFVLGKSSNTSGHLSSPSLSPSAMKEASTTQQQTTKGTTGFALTLSLPGVHPQPLRRPLINNEVSSTASGGGVELHYAVEASPSTASASISTRSKASSFSISTSSLPSSSPFLGSPSRTGGVSPVSPMPSATTTTTGGGAAHHAQLSSHAASSTASTLLPSSNSQHMSLLSHSSRPHKTRHKHKHTLSFDEGVLGKIAAEVTQQARINRDFDNDEPATNDDNHPVDSTLNASRSATISQQAPVPVADLLTPAPALASSPRANSGQLHSSGPTSASSGSGLPPRTPTPTNSSLASTLALSSPMRQSMNKLAPLQSLSRSTSTDCFPSNSTAHATNHSNSNNPPPHNLTLTHAHSESGSHYAAAGQQAVSPSNRRKSQLASGANNTSGGVPRVRRGSASHSLSHSQSLSSSGGVDSSNPLSPTPHLLSISPSAPLSGSASPTIVSPQSASYRRSAPSGAPFNTGGSGGNSSGNGGPQSPLPPMIQRRSYSGNGAVVMSDKEKDAVLARDRVSEIPLDSIISHSGPSSNRSSGSLHAVIDLHPSSSPRLTGTTSYPAQFTTSPSAVKVTPGGRSRDGTGPIPFKDISPRNSGTPGRKNSARSPIVGLPVASFTAQHSHATQAQQPQQQQLAPQQIGGYSSLPLSSASSTNTSFNSQITPFSFHHMASTSTMASSSTAFDFSSSHQQSPAFSPRRSGGPLNVQSPALRSASSNSLGNDITFNLQAGGFEKKKVQNQPSRASASQAQAFALSAHLLSQHGEGGMGSGGNGGLGMGLVPRSRSGSVILPPLAPMSNPATPGPSHAVPPDFDLDVHSSGPPDTMSLSLPVDFKLPPQSFVGTKPVQVERALSAEQRDREEHSDSRAVVEATSPRRPAGVAPHSVASPGGSNKRLLPHLHHHPIREVPLTELPAGLPADDRIGFGVLHTGDADRRPMSPPLDLEQLRELENAPTRGSDRNFYFERDDSDGEEGTSMRDHALRDLRSPRPLHIHAGMAAGAAGAAGVFSHGLSVGRSSVSAAQAALEAMQAVAAATRAPLALHKSVPKLNLNAVSQQASAASALASPLPPDSYRPDMTPPPLKPAIATAPVISKLSMKIQSLDLGGGLGQGLESLGTHTAADAHLTMTEREFVSFDLDAGSENPHPSSAVGPPELLGMAQHGDRADRDRGHHEYPLTGYQPSPSGSPPTLPPSNVGSASASPDVGLSHNLDSPAAMALDPYSPVDIADAHATPFVLPAAASVKVHASNSNTKHPRSNIIPADPHRMSHF